MKITLTADNEKAELEGDDELIRDSVMYNHAFQYKVTEMIKAFYACKEESPCPHD